jgi:hypothetical protein
MKRKLSVIVPCYNEEKNIVKFYNKILEDLKDIDLELIFINDGSKDKTQVEVDKLLKNKDFKIKCINFSRNFGKESAMLAGLENVRKDADYISIIDADLQQNPKYLLKMYKYLNENLEIDEVACYQKKRKEGILSIFKKTFYKIINSFSEVEFKNGVSDFRMFRRPVLEAIISIKEHNRFSKGIFSYVGFNIYYMPYEVEKREEGKTSWNFFSLFSYALLGFKNFTNIFLNIIKTISLFLFLSSIIFLLVRIKLGIDKIDILIFLILSMTSINIFVLSLIMSYIKLIDTDTKNRPQYIIRRINTND